MCDTHLAVCPVKYDHFRVLPHCWMQGDPAGWGLWRWVRKLCLCIETHGYLPILVWTSIVWSSPLSSERSRDLSPPGLFLTSFFFSRTQTDWVSLPCHSSYRVLRLPWGVTRHAVAGPWPSSVLGEGLSSPFTASLGPSQKDQVQASAVAPG